MADERDTTCCYAKQDKFWVKDAPNGESWEFYTVLEDSATFYGQDESQACGGPAGSSRRNRRGCGLLLSRDRTRARTARAVKRNPSIPDTGK